MRDEMLKRLDELLGRASKSESYDSFYPMPESKVRKQWGEWQAIRKELLAERCENCRLWDSDPSSAPQVQIPEKTYVRVCFGLTLQDVWGGNFGVAGARSAILTGPGFGCPHFERKGPTP